MPLIYTCSENEKQTSFDYSGTVETGVTVRHEKTEYQLACEVFRNVLEHFSGQMVPGGFSMTEPTPGGVGEYLDAQNPSLTPRHASFLCAILKHEGFVQCSMNGNAVMVTFPKVLRCSEK